MNHSRLLKLSYFSIPIIFSTRTRCFPPRNSALRYAFTSSHASSIPTVLAPSVMMLALLCSFAILAENVSVTSAARIPSTLLAAMLIPILVPHTRIAQSYSPATTPSATSFISLSSSFFHLSSFSYHSFLGGAIVSPCRMEHGQTIVSRSPCLRLPSSSISSISRTVPL